jgi:hypothetical protein
MGNRQTTPFALPPWRFNVTKDPAGRPIVELMIGEMGVVLDPNSLANLCVEGIGVAYMAMKPPEKLRELADEKERVLVKPEGPRLIKP